MTNVSRRRTLLMVGGIGTIATAAGATVAWRTRTHIDDSERSALLSMPFADTEGISRRLADWGNVVRVVNFWATWCPPCVEEMPALERLHQDYLQRGAVVIGVGIDSAERIRAFRQKFSIGFPLLIAGVGGSDLGRGFGNLNGVLPYTVILNREGAVAYRRAGLIDPQTVRNALDPMLTMAPE